MLDLRLPIGIFFLIVGAILAISGFLNPAPVQGVPQIDLDRDWGVVLVVFGALMTASGAVAQKNTPPVSPDEGLTGIARHQAPH